MNTTAKIPQTMPQMAATFLGTAKNANHKEPNTKTIQPPSPGNLRDVSVKDGPKKWTLPNGRDTPTKVMRPPTTARNLPRILPGDSALRVFEHRGRRRRGSQAPV